MSEERELQLARRQLDAVHQISAALHSVTHLETLQRLALETMRDVVEADAGSLLVHDPERNALVFALVLGPVADKLTGMALDLSTKPGIAGQVFLSGTANIANHVAHHSGHSTAQDSKTGYQTDSLITVPLRLRGGAPIGVVQLVNKRSGPFDAGDVAVVDVMGSLVALAMENSRMAEEAKMAAVARSIGEISHDIGNMLTHVLPYVQSLAGCIEDVRAEKPNALDCLEEFYLEVCEHVAEGVQQVQARTREIARAIKGEIAPMEFAPGLPFKMLQRVRQSLSGPAEKQQIALSIEGDADLEAVLDAERLFHAVYNLTNNALAETPAEGRITLAVMPHDDPEWYEIRVTDTGKGMPPEVVARMFTDAIKSTKAGGTGLGTRIARRVVEQHGGKASVVSAPGEGTTITLHLPRRPPEA